MNPTQAFRTDAARPVKNWALSLLSLTMALLFAFQGFLVNTHVHLAAQQSAGSSIIHQSESKVSQSNHGKSPAPDRDGACTLCLVAALAGVYTLPSAALLLQPAEFLAGECTHAALRLLIHIPHRAWQSRAPPIA